ncbi:RBR-type E3 ubiquitin transferase [Pleurostoma richardsiae]|uniref:RBR-type E3 ubiquitin transferase n=1 Tax=Pleurostoma richardsiae TaxID=41990 RepID=A0AA38RAV4_9PEZI|nr:RBR-type E3 ubiquitin transferase [Pleurostoma richardsiae]
MSSSRHHHRRPSTSVRAAAHSISSSVTSMRLPRSSTMPLMTRPTTTVAHRRLTAKDSWPYDEDRISRSDSRRSGSRRDVSPPSAHQYRSTPDTRRSSRTSVSESDDETDVTVSTQDEREERSPRRQVKDLYVVPVERRRRRHHQSRPRKTQQEIIYEEEDGEDEERDQEQEEEVEEEVYQYREEDDRRSRHAPRLEEKRSQSRHSSDRHGRREYQRLPHGAHRDRSRIPSIDDERPSPSPKRSSKRYYESEMVHSEKPPSSLRRSNTTGVSQVTTSQTVSSSAKRSSTFLGSFFGSSLQAHASEKPVKIVDCVVCMDELPSRKTAKLKCGHRMCNHCLKRSFKLSITDPQHMPPKCCTSDNIPLKHVERLFDMTFKKNWNKKFAEYSSRNRIYCPSRRCGEWIRPEDTYHEDGRVVAKCGHCKTKVCCACNGKWHKSRECPGDDETNRLLEQAKEEGWQRCYRCKAMVELKEGCNHMTCRCGAEFCMICGAKWKGCECPWFNYDDVENDRLDHMQIPIPIRTGRADYQTPPSPRDYRPGGPPPLTAARPRPRSYEEEMYLRRLQEQRDGHLARRLQVSDDYHDRDDYLDDIGDVTGLGNQAGHFMNDNYRRRPEPIVVPPPPPPPIPIPQFNPFERVERVERVERASSGPDYVSGINRARGVRASSLERRLADRFNPDLRHSPTNRSSMADYTGPPPTLRTSMTMPPMPTTVPVAMPAVPPPPSAVPMARRHTLEDDRYNSPRSRLSERLGPNPRMNYDYADYESEVAPHSPHGHRQHLRDPPKQSIMAGLGGQGRGMDRVSQWRTHVEPGLPEAEAA